MAHQEVGRARLDAKPEYFAIGAEQGTGKTWMLLDEAERRHEAKDINGLLVVAPKGVHSNWVRREIPTHLEAPHRAEYYVSGGGVLRERRVARLMKPSGELDILTINFDALNSKKGYAVAREFLASHKAIMDVDESARIKTPGAARTKNCRNLGKLARARRIASGTMITNSPMDLFSQFEFLKPGGNLLGTTSHTAFMAEYAQLLPPTHDLVEYLIESNPRLRKMRSHDGVFRRLEALPKIIEKDKHGRPIYRNLDKLHKLLQPNMYRVLKRDCLDLPDKIYQTRYFELTPSQRRVYQQAKKEFIYERDTGQIDRFTALTKIGKLRQITSGFIMLDGQPTSLPAEGNPRMELMEELIEDIGEGQQFIIWAYYHEEINNLVKLLEKMGISIVQYHGQITSDKEREAAVDDFQAGNAQCFIGNQDTGGIGLTLTAAEIVFFYSNDYAYDKREQAEDRSHRIGTTEHVLYVDLVGADTIDEDIAAAQQSKADVASAILDGV